MYSKQELKRMIYAEKQSLKEKEIFTSPAFRQVCENILQGVGHIVGVKTFNVKTFWGTASDPVAWATEKCEFGLNLNNALVAGKKMSIKDRYDILIGLLCHEASHRLWTNFKESYRILNLINSGYLGFTDSAVLDDYLANHPGECGYMAKIFHKVYNAIEDGYIERRFIKTYKGYAPYLQKVRRIHQSDSPSMDELIAKGLSKPQLLLNAILMYAKYGEEPDGDAEEISEIIDGFYHVKQTIDTALSLSNSKERTQKYAAVLNDLVEFFIEEERKRQEQQQQTQNQQQPSNQQNSNDPANSNQQSSSDGDSDDEESDESEAGGNDDSEGDNSDDSSDEENGGSDNEGNDDGSDSDAGDGSSDSQDTDISSLLAEIASAIEEEGDDAANTPAYAPLEESPAGDSSSIGSEDSGQDAEPSGAGIESLLNQIAEEKMEGKIEAEIRNELNTLKNNMPTSQFHRQAALKVQRMTTTTPARDFGTVDAENRKILRRMISEFKKSIKDLQIGDNLKGLYAGRRVSQPYRADLKRFSSRKAPSDVPDMSVILLIDQSGSMDGEREEAARDTAMLVYRFCEEMGIRLAVYGHSVINRNPYSTTRLTSYSEFDSVDGKDIYRISNLMNNTKGCNRDGFALRFCAEKLALEPSAKKILMIISDGAPNDTDYGFRYCPNKANTFTVSQMGNAKLDIDDILKTYRKKGIGFIACGIGEDSEQLKDLYTYGLSAKVSARYLDISNLEDMPKTFIEILKKEII